MTPHAPIGTPSPAEHASAVADLLAPLVARLAEPVRAEVLTLGDARGRVLSDDVLSPGAVPPFANSQMDGYAVAAADLAGASADAPVRLRVGATSAAGDPVGSHAPGTASPVMTGAPIPRGADAVVQIEVVDPPHFFELGGDVHDVPGARSAGFSAAVDPGSFVRPEGADLQPGAVVLRAGTRLGPVQLGSLAAAGIVSVAVRPVPRVLLVSTGHELRRPGETLGSGQIHDANTTSLSAALVEAGATVVTAFAPDDADALRAAIAAQSECDLVVTTGGVSAGAFEVVRDALEPEGVSFGSVAMQPGGPQGLGTIRAGERVIPVLAFPGNPVSALLSFEMFLRPVLRRIAGRSPHRRAEHAALAHDITSPAAKHQVRRGTLRPDGTVEVGAPGSHLLHAYALADVLVHVPIGVDALAVGTDVEIWRIDD
ncbi:gephyrin-like molybdotransferase Glp [Microbacterium sp.]|uniref:molybdopterin molybdotransferase MoeA n=1 Tax=Microbacterium sp. TaxID=51671 RepID=UPI00333E61CA